MHQLVTVILIGVVITGKCQQPTRIQTILSSEYIKQVLALKKVVPEQAKVVGEW